MTYASSSSVRVSASAAVGSHSEITYRVYPAADTVEFMLGAGVTSPRVKICGIRSAADLRIAVASGADAVGFISGVIHRSEDALAPAQAAMLVQRPRRMSRPCW